MAGDYLNPDASPEGGYEDGTEGDAFDASLLDEQPLPECGDYECVCTDADLTKSKKGNAMVVATLASLDHTRPADAKYYIVNAKGSTRYSEGLAVFGVTKEQVKDAFLKGGSSAVKPLFVGKKIAATGKHEVFLGNKQFKFDDLKPPVEGAGFREFGSDEAA